MAAQELLKTVLKDNANLKAYYRFESGALETDSSGNAVTLTNTGTVAAGTGVYGGAADLGASNSTKSLSSTNTLSINGGAITMAGWFKLNTEIGSSTQILLGHLNNTTATYERIYYDYNGGTRKLLFMRTKPGVADQGVEKTITLGTSNWYHLAFTYDATSVRGWINGQCIGTLAASGNGTGTYTQGIFIGQDQGGGFQPSALIDDVAFFNVALSADQIKELYEGRFIGESYPQAGLVGGWHLNGSSTDFSGNNNHGTDTAITYSQANGKFGQGAGFNGSTSKIAHGLTNFPLTTSARTQMAWVKLAAQPATNANFYIMTYGAGSTNNMSAFIYKDTSGTKYLSFGGYANDKDTAYTLSNNVWYHLAQTVSGTTVSHYVNGNLVGSGSISAPNTTSSSGYIGIAFDGASAPFNGAIDEVLIFNRALSAQEIRRMYALGTGKLQ